MLLKESVLEKIILVMIILIISGNGFAFVTRVLMKRQETIQKFLVLNLTVSDFLMGVYLLGIYHKQMIFRGNYYLHDKNWRSSNGCRALGAIALLSSEVSITTLAAITYVRYRFVIRGFRYKKLSSRLILLVLAAIWFFGLCVSVIPAVVKSYFYNESKSFYGENGLCFSLQLPHEKPPGWEYSLAIFCGINLVLLSFIIFGYTRIIHDSCFKLRNEIQRNGNEDTLMAIRIFLLVFTDIICWVPVTILLFLSMAKAVNDENDVVYAWFVVVVIPINSALNPLLYTFIAPRVWVKIKELFRTQVNKLLRFKGTTTIFFIPS